MSKVLAMPNTPDILQQVFALRGKANAPNEALRQKIKTIEPLLSEKDGFSDWRRGTMVSGNGRSELNAPRLNTKWKSSYTSLGSAGSTENHSPIPSTPTENQKYQSKFKNTSAPVEDTILNTIIMNKLNKFSASTYDEIKQFLYQILNSGETGFIKDFMGLVFRKAASEEIFCPLYAKLLAELRNTYPVIQDEMVHLFAKYTIIFEAIDETTNVDYQTFVKRNIEKKYRLGYSQFLAELCALEAVDLDSFQKTFTILMKNVDEQGKIPEQTNEIQEYCDCLLRMSKVFQKRNGLFFIRTRQLLFKKIQTNLYEILNAEKSMYPSLSPKARFALMDVRDILQSE
jgi:hypothetical protein